MEQKQLVDVLMRAIAQALADVHTATVAKVTRVSGSTIACRPVVNRLVNGQSVALPEFVDVPVWVLQGGGSYLAMPVAVGDYCLLIFTERCIDRWYGGDDFQPPLELRMHDYSDGIALVGLNPLASAIPIPGTIKQVGDTVQEGDYTHAGNMERDGDTVLNGNLTVNGNIAVSGNITCGGVVSAAGFSGLNGTKMVAAVDIETTGDVKAGGKSLKTHTHPVTTAPGTTGAPT